MKAITRWKHRILLALLAVLFVAVLMTLSEDRSQEQSSDQTIGRSLAEHSVLDSIQQHRGSEAGESALMAPKTEDQLIIQNFNSSRARLEAFRATSAGELQKLSRQARMSGNESLARELELMEDDACGSLARDDVGEFIDRDGEGFRRWETFCADTAVDPLVDNYLMRSKILDSVQSEVEQKLDDLIRLMEYMNPADALIELIIESASPAEINAISLMIANGYVDQDSVTALTEESENLGPLRAPNIYRAALDIYSCQRFGHCGPQNFASIEYCLLLAECQPGQDYLDLLSWTMSPRDLERAVDIVDRIRRREAHGGG